MPTTATLVLRHGKIITAAGTSSVYGGHDIGPDLMLASKHLWAEGAMAVRSPLFLTPRYVGSPSPIRVGRVIITIQ